MAKARWLNPQQARAWMSYIDATTLLGDYLDQQLRRDVGLTHTDYNLLARLSSAHDRALPMSQLAEALKITRSRLTHAVNRLEQAGYVRRREHPTDRRGQITELTDQGAQLLDEAAPGHVEAVRAAVFGALTREQVRQLTQISDAIAQAVQQAQARADHPATLPWQRR